MFCNSCCQLSSSFYSFRKEISCHRTKPARGLCFQSSIARIYISLARRRTKRNLSYALSSIFISPRQNLRCLFILPLLVPRNPAKPHVSDSNSLNGSTYIIKYHTLFYNDTRIWIVVLGRWCVQIRGSNDHMLVYFCDKPILRATICPELEIFDNLKSSIE